MESHEKMASVAGTPRRRDNIEMQVNGTPPRQLKDLDDLFPYIGDFGWYQRMLFLLMIPYSFFFAFIYFSQIFMTVVPSEHWCLVPELGNLSVEMRRHLAIPQREGSYEKCIMYDVDWQKILESGVVEPNQTWPTKKCNDRWEFNFTDVPYETVATQLFWVCERDNYAATAQSVFFCGAIVGGFIFGWIADKYGRVPAILGTNMTGFLAGVGTAFSNSFWSFCLCRFLVGLAYDNCFMIMYIVVVEYVGPKWRTFVANMSIAVYFTFAACLLPWIALGVADWRIYTLITSIPLVLSVFTPCVVPESARWLISQGRIEEALKIIQKCERVNKRKIPEEVLKEFRETATQIAESEKEIKNYSFLDLFKTPRLRTHSILLLIIWTSIAMVFDGHVRNVGSLGLDMFVTFTIATATEFPADILLILTLDIVGRRWLAFGSMVLSGLFSFAATAVPFGLPSASLAIIGRFAVNISFNIGMQYAAELLPTVLRAQGLALIHITGYVATILVPYIVYLATIATEIPLLILGSIGIVGGCLCLCLPESMGKDMPQTIQDGEDYGRDQKFWDFPCFKRKNRVAAEPDRNKDSSTKCKDGSKCSKSDTSSIIQPDVLISELKPSVFNDYPYGLTDVIDKYENSNEINQQLDLGTIISGNQIKDIPNDKLSNPNGSQTNANVNLTSSNTKRSMNSQKDFETRVIKKIEFVEPMNDTDKYDVKLDRSVFDKEKDVVWHQTAPVDVNVYKVLPKTDENRFKPISERGLIKVLSMLTKTFKKIMKQHNDIKIVHKQLDRMNDDFMKNVNNLNKQFADFDTKYAEILKVNTELKKMEEKLKTREQDFDAKEKEFSKNLLDFENQQRKFLAQQKQFYSVQKLMLEQNEKINLKQNVIAKTQSEISHRQNNFARILKKAKQLYSNIKETQGTTLNVGITRPTINKSNDETKETTTTISPTTKPVKINLLTNPEATNQPLRNYDKLILDEKDYQTIDDLIYKYYFNNTFIDEIMRNKILSSFGASEKRNAVIKKNKRNEVVTKKTTKLFPVNKIKNDLEGNVKRERRWIKHARKLSKTKVTKPVATTTARTIFKNVENKEKQVDIFKPNPFIVMATSFCNEIGQNGNAQILSWCIEKALRRLQVMDMHLSKILPSPGVTKADQIPVDSSTKSTTLSGTQDIQTPSTPIKSSMPDITNNIISDKSNILMYFPDNDELESNLKQFEIIPDKEGTVYFDGSLHSSDIDKLTDRDSDAFSDIMPGLDSNSRVEVDPRAFDIQAQRRANVQRINERIMKLKMV